MSICMYNYLDLGCYCLDAQYEGTTYTFDATATINDPGRFINHGSKNVNLQLMKPIPIGEGPKRRLRIGFVAKREISAGEQLFFDYGVRDKGIPWLISDAKSGKMFLSTTSKWAQNRTHLHCGLCGAKNLAKLSQHLKQKHRIVDCQERKKHIENAQKVCNNCSTLCVTCVYI